MKPAMHTLTDVDLPSLSRQLIDDARRGEPTLVTCYGLALLMTMPLGPQAKVPATLLDLATMLYDGEQISLGRAAEVAGLAYSEMIDELGRRGIASIRLRPGELERELAAFGP